MNEFDEFRRQRQFRWGDPGASLPRTTPYVPGDYASREGDWDSTRGRHDYAGYGLVRPSPHGWIQEK